VGVGATDPYGRLLGFLASKTPTVFFYGRDIYVFAKQVNINENRPEAGVSLSISAPLHFLGPSNRCVLKQNCEQMEIKHLLANGHTLDIFKDNSPC
jgi:hypothetical protein